MGRCGGKRGGGKRREGGRWRRVDGGGCGGEGGDGKDGAEERGGLVARPKPILLCDAKQVYCAGGALNEAVAEGGESATRQKRRLLDIYCRTSELSGKNFLS